LELCHERARDLILAHGWNTTCYQILNPGIELWFCDEPAGVVGYVQKGRIRVVAGSPVCAQEDLDAVLDRWHEDCDRVGHRTCYFGAEDRLGARLRNKPGYSTAVLGAQPVWRTEAFIESTDGDRSLRYQLSRAKHKGVTVKEWPVEEAVNHPELRACLDAWLETRGLPPMHFLVEPNTLGCLMDRRLFVAERNGVAVSFVVLSPVPSRRGWLTEQFVRGHSAPNGTIELNLYRAIQTLCDGGSDFVTMGIVPLSAHGFSAGSGNPGWLKLVASWTRAHGRRFYNFDGLDRFKTKFHPDSWEPIYAISREDEFSFSTLYAIAAAFCDGSPLTAMGLGLLKALRQEAIWLSERFARPAQVN